MKTRNAKLSPVKNGGVDVDQVDLPGELLKECREYILFVPPDQTIAPIAFSTAPEQVERDLTLLRGLVDCLDGLKRECDTKRGDPVAVLAVLAFPDKLRQRRS
jgi:hypothetical protein